MSDHLEHFIELARRGALPGASGGELRATQLACVIRDCVPGLDNTAVGGLLTYVLVAQAQPSTAEAMLEGRCTFVSEDPAPAEYQVPKLLKGEDLAEKIFFHVYDALAQLGYCDGPRGAEYDRVLAEWVSCSRPDNVGGFILDRANAIPLEDVVKRVYQNPN